VNSLLRTIFFGFSLLLVQASAATKPNVLWITIEDWSPDLSCYGTKGIHTPHVDQLASEGIRYERAFTTSPVCSTSRSAMMTGFHQNYIGAHQHRTDDKKPLPYGIRPIPHLLADAGYFTAIMSWKTDCNFLPDTREGLFQGKDWSERKSGQPFFARITFGGTHRAWKRDPQRPIEIEDVELPPYYADTPFIRRDWANGLEQMQLVDREVATLLKRLDDEGLADNTIVFFIGDHGRCHIRGKQFLYDGGTRIPMIMRWPGKVKPGQVNDDLVYSIDICATVLEAAGVEAPVALHGESLFSNEVKQRQYVFAARDKMDDAHDAMRSIRSRDHKLILNLMPERAYCQFSHYKESAYPPLAEMNVLNLQGKLSPEQAAFMAPNKPEIELFDLKKDPHEVKNVAADPAYVEIKATLLKALDQWRKDVINDQGVSAEFRAKGLFPAKCPTSTVGEWVEMNGKNYNFALNGSPPWFPTRTLEEWITVRDQWKPYVFRSPDEKVARPKISFTQKPKKKKKKKAKNVNPAGSSPSSPEKTGRISPRSK
jgi:N-sulfoglucosamine sulfohydrolase